MQGLFDIASLLAFICGGALLAKIRLAPKSSVVDGIVRYVLWALLFSMGFRIGNNPELYANLATMGVLALATALLAITGSCLAVYGTSFIVPGLRRKGIRGANPDSSPRPSGSQPFPSPKWSTRARVRAFASQLKAPLKLLAFVVAGLMVGLLLSPSVFDMAKVTGWTLDALLFFIGMQFTQSGTSLKKALASPAAIAVPLATIVGTLASSLVLVPLFSLSAGKAMALAGGFGWYSLSGVLISNLGDPLLGSVSFLANMFRESIALLLIPFLGRSAVPAMAVSVGGATAMDVTLPLIEQSAGPWIVPVSFMSGALLSLIVPFLVPICFSLG
ncbi:MAG TPA: lysine exporter LysO family protein [Rectinemataceae bacterium]|nr:lysine exporter LysO family protein [Rectinemataceae bacterium]